MEWYYIWWPWLTSNRIARVCQHQLSFLWKFRLGLGIESWLSLDIFLFFLADDYVRWIICYNFLLLISLVHWVSSGRLDQSIRPKIMQTLYSTYLCFETFNNSVWSAWAIGSKSSELSCPMGPEPHLGSWVERIAPNPFPDQMSLNQALCLSFVLS